MAFVYQGTKIAPGIAKGRVCVIQKINLDITQYKAEDSEQEIIRFRTCHKTAVRETEEILQNANEKLGEHEAQILDAQLTLLQDEYAVVEPIEDAIREDGLNTAQAIESIMSGIKEMFAQAEDEYMRERANDAEDVRRRLLARALNITVQDYSVLPKDTVLIAEELTPSDTLRMDLRHIAGIATARGGYYSHVGIISRGLGIPSVCGVKEAVHTVKNGDTVIVDGDVGTLILNPDSEYSARFEERCLQRAEAAAELSAYRFIPSQTQNGERGLLCANIGSAAEAETAFSSGAEGIGLMRSEFLYMNRTAMPDEQTQFQAYRRVLETAGDRPVIIRTLDVGGDKALPYLPSDKEDNPFLGCRAIRLCLKRRELFRVQLRALLRASVYGNLKIMFPMISGIEELDQAKELLKQAGKELEEEGVQTAQVEVGIMIEVPAAALLSDCLAGKADFFSIGTNDLIQYTVAAERGNRAVENLYSPYHPAVLRLINMTARAAARANIPCGMCGEAAADPALIPVFWGMGLRELSMSPGAIAGARKVLAGLSTKDCRAQAERALGCTSTKEVEELLSGNRIPVSGCQNRKQWITYA